MITWCWLAEHACIKLVSRFKRILKRNFRNASLLSLIFNTVISSNVKENQHATKRSHLEEEQKDFSDEKRIDSQRENSSVETAGVERSTRQLRGLQTES